MCASILLTLLPCVFLFNLVTSTFQFLNPSYPGEHVLHTLVLVVHHLLPHPTVDQECECMNIDLRHQPIHVRSHPDHLCCAHGELDQLIDPHQLLAQEFDALRNIRGNQ